MMGWSQPSKGGGGWGVKAPKGLPSLKVQVLSSHKSHTQYLMPVLIGQCPRMCLGSILGACSDWPMLVHIIDYMENHHLLLIRMRTYWGSFPSQFI